MKLQLLFVLVIIGFIFVHGSSHSSMKYCPNSATETCDLDTRVSGSGSMTQTIMHGFTGSVNLAMIGGHPAFLGASNKCALEMVDGSEQNVCGALNGVMCEDETCAKQNAMSFKISSSVHDAGFGFFEDDHRVFNFDSNRGDAEYYSAISNVCHLTLGDEDAYAAIAPGYSDSDQVLYALLWQGDDLTLTVSVIDNSYDSDWDTYKVLCDDVNQQFRYAYKNDDEIYYGSVTVTKIPDYEGDLANEGSFFDYNNLVGDSIHWFIETPEAPVQIAETSDHNDYSGISFVETCWHSDYDNEIEAEKTKNYVVSWFDSSSLDASYDSVVFALDNDFEWPQGGSTGLMTPDHEGTPSSVVGTNNGLYWSWLDAHHGIGSPAYSTWGICHQEIVNDEIKCHTVIDSQTLKIQGAIDPKHSEFKLFASPNGAVHFILYALYTPSGVSSAPIIGSCVDQWCSEISISTETSELVAVASDSHWKIHVDFMASNDYFYGVVQNPSSAYPTYFMSNLYNSPTGSPCSSNKAGSIVTSKQGQTFICTKVASRTMAHLTVGSYERPEANLYEWVAFGSSATYRKLGGQLTPGADDTTGLQTIANLLPSIISNSNSMLDSQENDLSGIACTNCIEKGCSQDVFESCIDTCNEEINSYCYSFCDLDSTTRPAFCDTICGTEDNPCVLSFESNNKRSLEPSYNLKITRRRSADPKEIHLSSPFYQYAENSEKRSVENINQLLGKRFDSTFKFKYTALNSGEFQFTIDNWTPSQLQTRSAEPNVLSISVDSKHPSQTGTSFYQLNSISDQTALSSHKVSMQAGQSVDIRISVKHFNIKQGPSLKVE